MTDMLIERLEKAGEGSRILDARIAVAAQLNMPEPMGDAEPYLKMPHKLDECADGTYWLVQRSGMSLRTAPQYSTNLQDAFGLVLEGWQYGISTHPPDELFNPGGAQAYVMKGMAENYQHSDAATPALALCIACLRALEKADE